MTRTESVLLRLTAEELELFDRASSATGLDRSSWMRLMLRRAAGDETASDQLLDLMRPTAADVETLRAALGEPRTDSDD